MQDSLLKRADNCVYCGLCSQYCPTYARECAELESPRGRVITSLKVLQNELDTTPGFQQHIKNCLFCGACERACPAGVPVIELLSTIKSKLKTNEAREIRWLSQHPKLAGYLAMLGAVAKILKITRLPFLKKYDKFLAKTIGKKLKSDNKSQIMFFSGCSLNFDPALGDIQNLLTLCNVKTRNFGECCGAVHAHAGDIKTGESMLDSNLNKLKTAEKIIFVNPGCQDFIQKLHTQTCEVFEACEFIANNDKFARLKLKPLHKTALVHIPCSQQYNANARQQLSKILSLVPELDFKFFSQHSCCGASKLYSERPDDYYVRLLLAETEIINPDLILSANFACRQNFKAAAQDMDKDVKIMHPLSLIFGQL